MTKYKIRVEKHILSVYSKMGIKLLKDLLMFQYFLVYILIYLFRLLRISHIQLNFSSTCVRVCCVASVVSNSLRPHGL